jgi:hypothetical protein
MKLFAHSRIYIALAAGLLSAGLPSVLAAQAGDVAVENAEAQARKAWRQTMHESIINDTGCFHASYPSTEWEKVECSDAQSYRSAKFRAGKPTTGASSQTAGDGYDYVAQSPGGDFIHLAIGSFPTVTDVTSEKTVNVPFGGGYSTGIPGPNEYTLQLNTNFAYTAACDGYTGCSAWQQYAVLTNTAGAPSSNVTLSGTTQVLIEYTLINYGVDNGSNICPPKFEDDGPTGYGGDYCVQNSPAAVMYNGQIPITELSSLELSGSAVVNGKDKATAIYGTEAYAATVEDVLTDIAGAWNQAEFNVFGNQNGSEAAFNTGASLSVKIALEEGSSAAPTCIAPGYYNGTTGETNNLNLGTTCTVAGGSSPYIEFTESD